jgi:hypothetical protein
MRITIRDMLWLITGIAIGLAVTSAFLRREYARLSQHRMQWRQERAVLDAEKESEIARANAAESELKAIERQGHSHVVISTEGVTARLNIGDTAQFKLRADGNLDYQVSPKSASNEAAQ